MNISYIGWADKVVNPDAVFGNTCTATSSEQELQSQAWKDKDCITDVPSFSHAQMVTYFVSRTVSDGLPAGDFNAMNKKAKRIFDCGHVQNIQVCTSLSCVWIRDDCHPEMKKNTVYKRVHSLSEKSYDIESAKCGCKAGKGPMASCKHIGATCYEFCKSGKLSDILTCTQKLQEWNRPRNKKVEILPVVARKQEILKKSSYHQCPVPSQYDPRPPSMRQVDENFTEDYGLIY